MTVENATERDLLIDRLTESPFAFDFFQAVRRLENLHRDAPPVGESRRLSEDFVRFCQLPSLAFPASTVARYVPGDGAHPARLFVNFLGLLGPNGPMPLHLTEHVDSRQRHHGDATTARFLDIFHHRMIAFFYRAWACNQQTVSTDRQSPQHDRFARYFGSLFGIGMSSLRDRDAIPDLAKIHFSGHLAGRTRHAEGLRAILNDFFRISVQIVQFVGQWLPLPEDCRCRLGQTPATGTVGMTAIVGSKIWDCQQKFRIRMGPMRLDDYERMLPAGQSLRRLDAWVRNYVGDELDWDVQLVLLANEVPAIQLGRMGHLGWTTWLRSKPFASDADDLVLGGPAWRSTKYGSL